MPSRVTNFYHDNNHQNKLIVVSDIAQLSLVMAVVCCRCWSWLTNQVANRQQHGFTPVVPLYVRHKHSSLLDRRHRHAFTHTYSRYRLNYCSNSEPYLIYGFRLKCIFEGYFNFCTIQHLTKMVCVLPFLMAVETVSKIDINNNV